MFLNDLYTISKICQEDNGGKITFIIQLNPEHEIFKGHFPGNPILPGVCIVQILKELLMHHLDNKLILTSAGTIKYLAFLNPDVNATVNFDVQLKQGDEDLYCDASLNSASVTYCRFKGEFKVIYR